MASLTREEAQQRAALLDVERYDLELDLTGLLDGATLLARSSVRFTALAAGDTFVDVVADSAQAWLDGEEVPAAAYDGERFALTLTEGAHELVVTSSTDRTSMRAGIHRAVDPGDGEAYVWTSFEPDDARRVFACFDQPDLKAVFGITVVAPSRWTVASNSPMTSLIPGPDARTWRFADTPRLSTYLAVVCAGPFARVNREVHGYELTWLARSSLAGYLEDQADELFDLTAAGLQFFGERFAMRFPQRTYTQVFCPDFQGAMENWGCVTWMDSFLFRTPPTAAERELRAVILLHEMAHMWFGDIVTMRWWDDLWLNESFADWAAVWATASATEHTGAWASFLGGRKEAGYAADASPSTHPIRQDVPTVEAAKAAFDMVTYAKGASVLRQLTAYAGEEAFVTGLRRHFADHAWGNATLDDLLEAVGSASGRDLPAWAGEWLLKAGTDVLSLTVDTDGERYREVTVGVTPPEADPAQRPHRLRVGVYDVGGPAPLLRRTIELDAVGPATDVPELRGEPVAELLLLNDGDLTFARVRPDEASLAAMLRHGPHLPDPLSRALCRMTLWHLLDDGLLPPADLLTYLVRALDAETSPAVRDGLLRTGVVVALDWSDPETARSGGDALAAVCAELAVRAEAAGDAPGRLSALHAALAVAREPRRLDELAGLCGDDVDLGWRLLTARAAAGGYAESDVDALVERDPDPDAESRAATVRAARPEAAAKEEAWRALFVDRTVPLQAYGPVGRAFWDPGHAGVLEPFAQRYLDELPALGAAGMTATLAATSALFPRHGVDASFPERALKATEEAGVTPLVASQVRERAATLGRMLRARNGG